MDADSEDVVLNEPSLVQSLQHEGLRETVRGVVIRLAVMKDFFSAMLEKRILLALPSN